MKAKAQLEAISSCAFLYFRGRARIEIAPIVNGKENGWMEVSRFCRFIGGNDNIFP
jgi:hypothetical protein